MKLKTKIITIEVETNLPNKAFTKMTMQSGFNRAITSNGGVIFTVKQVSVNVAQPAKQK